LFVVVLGAALYCAENFMASQLELFNWSSTATARKDFARLFPLQQRSRLELVFFGFQAWFCVMHDIESSVGWRIFSETETGSGFGLFGHPP
jgi:hypothetical protein